MPAAARRSCRLGEVYDSIKVAVALGIKAWIVEATEDEETRRCELVAQIRRGAAEKVDVEGMQLIDDGVYFAYPDLSYVDANTSESWKQTLAIVLTQM